MTITDDSRIMVDVFYFDDATLRHVPCNVKVVTVTVVCTVLYITCAEPCLMAAQYVFMRLELLASNTV